MNLSKRSHHPSSPGRGRDSKGLLGELRRRGIFGTLAAFVGTGWLAYEIVHFILVEHYGLPDRLKDIAIIGVVCATLCGLTLRWFGAEKKPRKPRWELILVPVFILTAAAATVDQVLRMGTGEPKADPEAAGESVWTSSLAVLPFLNMSGDPGQDYFCDGLTEEMITKLSQIEKLRVTARTSAFAFKGQGGDVREIGRRLGVDKILEGSVRKDGSRLRITVQFINASDGFHAWSRTFDRDLDRIFVVQDEITRSVADTLKMSLQDRRAGRSQTRSLEAYDEFLRGRHAYADPSEGNLEIAERHFRKAVEIDPDYARAWAHLGGAIAFRANVGYIPVAGNREKALAAIERALLLDDRSAMAYLFRGWMRMSFDWDWAGADKDYSKALAIEPVAGLVPASQLELGLGRIDRDLAMAKRAADLDALNATPHMNLGFALLIAGRFEEARRSFEKTLRINPKRGNVHTFIAEAYLLDSRPDLALPHLALETAAVFRLVAEAMVFHALGRTKESRVALEKYISEFHTGNAYQIAQIYAFLGERDRAFEWLETAYRQHDGGLFLIKVDPFFKSLKPDPRFAGFLGKMRL